MFYTEQVRFLILRIPVLIYIIFFIAEAVIKRDGGSISHSTSYTVLKVDYVERWVSRYRPAMKGIELIIWYKERIRGMT